MQGNDQGMVSKTNLMTKSDWDLSPDSSSSYSSVAVSQKCYYTIRELNDRGHDYTIVTSSNLEELCICIKIQDIYQKF